MRLSLKVCCLLSLDFMIYKWSVPLVFIVILCPLQIHHIVTSLSFCLSGISRVLNTMLVKSQLHSQLNMCENCDGNGSGVRESRGSCVGHLLLYIINLVWYWPVSCSSGCIVKIKCVAPRWSNCKKIECRSRKVCKTGLSETSSDNVWMFLKELSISTCWRFS